MAAVARFLGSFLGSVFRSAWRVCRVLWVCRVAAVSALGGGALMAVIPQSVDLFADTGLPVWRWGWFFFSVFVWAWLVHAMGRRALQFDEWVPEAHRPGGLSDADRLRLGDVFALPAIWVPRLLGLFVIAAVARAILNMRADLAQADGLPQAERALAWSWVLLLGAALTAAGYIVMVLFSRQVRAKIMRSDKDPPLLNRTQSVFTLLLPKNWPELRKLLAHRVNRVLFAFALFITGVFLTALFFPESIPWLFPRVVFLPVLLGGGLLLFGEIASLSHRYSTPLLLIFFVIGGVLSLFLTHYNDVRWVAAAPASPTAGPEHEISIADAIARWKAANCTAEPCEVRPIVIAAAGGASRAGFFTASLVGALLDEAPLDPELGNIRNRIFALSTVSGSSLGGVMMRAAWADAQQAGNIDAPPCQNTGMTASYRSRAAEPQEFNQARKGSWRDCFQQLLAGDFLSPVFVGIAYRDIFPIGNIVTGEAFGLDRTGLLEQAFERWYREVTGSSGACAETDDAGLCRRLGHLPAAPQSGKTTSWMPLLFVNGTSVSTGRRILVSDVKIDCLQDGDVPFLNLAYDYRELREPLTRSGPRDCNVNAAEPASMAVDLRLSTAAMMSARFPIISTHGVIRDTDGNIVDSIVDGGYFENDGLATAADVVRELQAKGLHPLVIQTDSEPDEVRSVQQASADQRPPLPKSGARTLFDAYTSIGRALYATRSGQEDGHMAYLQQTLQGPLISVGVHPIEPGTGALCRSPVMKTTTMNVVSMSWWISQPVQAYLDAQLCAPEIDQVLICELKRGIGGDGKPTGAACLTQANATSNK
jgi:hypothetical protein